MRWNPRESDRKILKCLNYKIPQGKNFKKTSFILSWKRNLLGSTAFESDVNLPNLATRERLRKKVTFYKKLESHIMVTDRPCKACTLKYLLCRAFSWAFFHIECLVDGFIVVPEYENYLETLLPCILLHILLSLLELHRRGISEPSSLFYFGLRRGKIVKPRKKNEGLSPLLLYLYLTFFCEFCESFGKRFSNCVVKLLKDVYLNTPIDRLEHA